MLEAPYEIVQEGVKRGNWKTFLLENISTGQEASLLWAIGSRTFCSNYWVVFAGIPLK